MDFLFNEIPNHIVPFDFKTFNNHLEQFVVGTTDCKSGEAIYFTKSQHSVQMLDILRASSSLPFIAPAVQLGERELLDGGIVDPIPVKKSMKDGNRRNVIIMTKSAGYKKRPSKFSKITKLMMKRTYPNLSKHLHMRYQLYNETVSFVNGEEQKGNCFIIQPSIDISVRRIERNQQRISKLYELGYKDAERVYDKLIHWINR